MRELMLGPKRFGDIKVGLTGISANILTQRLESLEAAGILTRTRLPPPHSIPVYELTEWGYEAEPILQVLGRWASRSPAHDPTLPFGAVSLLLSLRTMFAPERAGDWHATIGLELDGESFTLEIRGGALKAKRGVAASPDAVFEGPARMVAAAIYGGQDLAALEAAGALRLHGDRAIATRLTTFFPLPAKAGTPPE